MGEPKTVTSSRLSAISAWGVTVYGALLPFHAFGKTTARRWLVLEPSELVLLAVAPAVLFEVLRVRERLLRTWIVRGAALLALAGMVAELASVRASRLAIAEQALGLLALSGTAGAVFSGRARQLMTGVLVGGVAALTIAVLGYVLALSTDLEAFRAFVFVSEHPLFPGWPRMTGTLGRHAVWLGEYCVMLLAVALAADERVGSARSRTVARVAAAAGLLASVSFAWFGGLVLALRGWFVSSARARPPRRWYRAMAVGLLFFTYALVSFWMLVGARVDPAHAGESRPCRELDGAHHVLRRGPARGVCQPVLGAEPYPHRVTLYALSHETSWERFMERPLLGGGRSQYGAFARAHAARVHRLGPIGYYQQPVGWVASTLAYTGLAGGAAFALMLYGVWRARPGPGQGAWQWIFYGALGLLLCGTQTDFELRGPLWLLLGLLVGFSREAPHVPTDIAASAPDE